MIVKITGKIQAVVQNDASIFQYCLPASSICFIMRPSSLGGGRILRRTLSVCLSVRPSRARMYFVYICTVLRANIQNRITSVFDYRPASRM